jgi:hypothetical protein
MFSSKSREPRIIYVAASARELPDEVQAWLGRPENRAASSPHVYDALALLAGGARPAVLIVSMEAVDWSEMEFFDQVARLCRETHVYVVGHDHQSAKIHAACKRGAMPFDEELIRESLAQSSAWSRGPGVSDLLAATLRQASTPRPMPATPLRPVPIEPEEPELPEQEESPFEPEAEAEPPEVREPEPAAETPAVRLIEPAEAETETEEEPIEEETDQPIPFPWAPAAKRPQRTPPKVQTTAAEPVIAAPAAPAATPAPAAPTPRQPVELTAEELAALMGRPIAPEKPAREGTG